MLGIQTHRMKGTDKTTELWQPPSGGRGCLFNICHLFFTHILGKETLLRSKRPCRQCDQMASLFAQYLTNSQQKIAKWHTFLTNTKKHSPHYCQIWSNCSHEKGYLCNKLDLRVL